MTDKYVIWSRSAYMALPADAAWRRGVEGALGYEPGTLPDAVAWYQAISEMESDLKREVDEVSERLVERADSLHGEWGGRLVLMATEVDQDDDYYYYEDNGPRDRAFAQFVGDTGPVGIFAGCQIEELWEDRAGTLRVEASYDGMPVHAAVRAVEPEVWEVQNDWDGIFAERVADGQSIPSRKWVELQDYLTSCWETGIGADMAAHRGYRWPGPEETLDEGSSTERITQMLGMDPSVPLVVDGYIVDCRAAHREGGERPLGLDLVTDRHAFYVDGRPEADGPVAMFALGDNGPRLLASEGYLAREEYLRSCEALATGGEARFVGPVARGLADAMRGNRGRGDAPER